jgi:hypothetical protein
VDDLAVPLSQFRALGCGGLNVLIAENKMTFLTLPAIPRALGIWGGGGAAELLAATDWLARCRLCYWGDLDVHGFHILSRLRRRFPEMVSVMMDEATLDRFICLAVSAREGSYEDVAGLAADEQRAYQRVSAGALLLEQEKIPHPHALHEIEAALKYRVTKDDLPLEAIPARVQG